jgi:hypothetical protein
MNNPSRAHMLAVLVFTGTLILVPALAASAHAERSAGPFDYEIGFGTEPAYAGQPNSVQLILNDTGKPVTDMTDQLKVEVSFGNDSENLSFEPNFEVGGDGDPGDYRAWFVPSQPGKYTFHLTGKLSGTTFDETVTSGPATFDTVQELSSVSFPKTNAPTNEQLATRIEQDASRTQAALRAVQVSADSASDAASSAKTLAIVGVVLGAIGIIAAIGALATRKRV